jgi:hypothetical protein
MSGMVAPAAPLAGGSLAFPSTVSGAGDTLNYLTDGNATTERESIEYGTSLSLTAPTTVTVDRLGSTFAPLYTAVANKVVVLDNLTTGGQGLTVTNLNGYGVRFTGTTTLSGAESFTVDTATNAAPNVTQGSAWRARSPERLRASPRRAWAP